MLLFENGVYQARVARVKNAMVQRGMELLLLASPANQFWLTCSTSSWEAYGTGTIRRCRDASIWASQPTEWISSQR